MVLICWMKLLVDGLRYDLDFVEFGCLDFGVAGVSLAGILF